MFEVLSNDEIALSFIAWWCAPPGWRFPASPVSSSSCGPPRAPSAYLSRIADDDPEAGTITLIIQAVGRSTQNIVAVPVGGALRDVAGPLGQPTHIAKVGRVVCVGGGAGTPCSTRWPRRWPPPATSSSPSSADAAAPFVVLRDELGAISSELICTTEDGTLGETGFVTQPLKRLLDGPEGQRPQLVMRSARCR